MDATTTKAKNHTPPSAAQRPQTEIRHGLERVDEYGWLRADNWQEVMRSPETLDPDIRAYLEAENAYCAAEMTDTEALQETLFAEMKGRIKEDDTSVPAADGPFDYYSSYVTGGQHPLYCRRPRGGGAEQVLIDGNALAEPHDYFRIGGVAHSRDHALIAYGADTNGSEYYAIRILDAVTLEQHGELIPDTAGGFVWAGDGKTLFYVKLDENHRPREVYRHVIGTSPGDDTLVYEEPDAGFYVGVSVTQDHRFVLIATHDHQTAEVRLIDADKPDQPPVLVAPRKAEQEYSIEHHDGRLIILTNADEAEDFKIVETAADAPGRENWSDIEPHRPGRLILDIVVYADHLVRLEREDGLPRIVIHRLSDG
ncbi:MAG: S9 family peptidase, partial [Hyphomicrobiales bacterium]|nr:S9 family peptidase [Hyphomicrobiales bacterium]